MKALLYLFLLLISYSAISQNLQLHYDLRHTVDPVQQPSNFPTLYFEYFKAQDSGKAFIKPGSFFFKMQADLYGSRNNIGKFFMQVSQSFRFWEPKIFVALQYSGGMGITEPRQYSYYISNTYSAGLSYPFTSKGAWFNLMLSYSYNALPKASNDFLFSFYWGKGFWKYKMEFVGDLELYSLNKNQGDDLTKTLNGKWICFFAEPQVWFNWTKSFAMGSKVNLFYHVLNFSDLFQAYPTLAVRFKF